MPVCSLPSSSPNIPSGSDSNGLITGMPDPATRSYPTTITTLFTTTHTLSAQPGTTTIDHITVIDPWPTSPDPELAPYTQTETVITSRTISVAGATPTTTTSELRKIVTWTVWTIQPFDMRPFDPPACPGPGGCSWPSIKPAQKCLDLKMQTRCAKQCVLKDWLWWCAEGQQTLQETEVKGLGPVGRVCAPTNSTVETWVPLLEPCDHTDWMPGCSICEGYDEPVEFPG